MKTRNGFVSNSSSSSYIVISKPVFLSVKTGFVDESSGRDTDRYSLNTSAPANASKNSTKDSGKYYARGIDCGEGIDFFELDAEMIKFLQDHAYDTENQELANNMSFYKVYGIVVDNDPTVRAFRKILDMVPDAEIDQVTVRPEEISIHRTAGVKELRANYFPHVPEAKVLSDEELKQIERRLGEEIRSLDNAKREKTAQLKKIKGEIEK